MLLVGYLGFVDDNSGAQTLGLAPKFWFSRTCARHVAQLPHWNKMFTGNSLGAAFASHSYLINEVGRGRRVALAPAERRGKNWCFALDERKCERVTPSVNSAGQTSNPGSPRQDAGPMRDPSVARAADALAAAVTPGDTAYKIGPLDVLDQSMSPSSVRPL
jgi:hypothetical protein